MDTFDKLRDICTHLLGPKGCPWVKQQSFQSLRPYFLEEAHELIEGCDEDDTDKIVEELGDVFFELVLMAKLGEIQGRFTLNGVIEAVNDKLIRRHPHVFGNLSIRDADELSSYWERMKKEEKPERKHPLEGIPHTLGALSRAQKVIGKVIRSSTILPESDPESSEDELIGDQFIKLIVRSCRRGIDAESAVRRTLKKIEQAFIHSETDRASGLNRAPE